MRPAPVAAVAALGARAGVDVRVMARAGAMLYAPGAVLVVITVALPNKGSAPPVLLACGLAALLVAVALLTVGDRLPADSYPVLTALGSVLITLLVHFGGSEGRGYALLYVWAVLYAFYFYRPAQATLQAGIVAAGAALSGNLGASPQIELLMIVGTVVVAGTWMRRAWQALMVSELTFRRLFADNPQPMWVYDTATLRFLAVNDAAVSRYGYSREEFLGMRLTDIGPEEEVATLLAEAAAPVEGATRTPTWRHRLRDGRTITVEVYSHAQRFEGTDARLVLVLDVTERARLEGQLRHQASHDPLTGLANRTLFRDRVERALDRRRPGGPAVAVALVDLDGFKGINDTLGHAVGDEVLVAVARRLQGALRSGDTPAHIGGDEFAVLLDDLPGPDAVRDMCERILEALRPPVAVSTGEVFVTASIGAAVSQPSDTGERLVQNADVAMYSAKSAGRDRCELYAPEMHARARRRLELTGDMRGAAERGELELQYQPVVSLATDRVVGVEALLRWRHPSRGLLPPAEFIPLAEETGLIVSMGSWVLETACRQVRWWQDNVPGASQLELSVNVSTRQLRDESLLATVDHALRGSGLAPEGLLLEVTETALVDDMDVTVALLRALRERGLRVAVDDFGAGYSSLGYLRGMPLDVVKIDRMFITGLGSGSTADRELTLAIVRLIDTLAVRTVAEGIETERELDYVRALGIDAGQGYLFSRPVYASEIPRLLRSRGNALIQLAAG